MKIVLSIHNGLVEAGTVPDGIEVELHDYDINEIEVDNPDRKYGKDELGVYELIQL